MTLYSEDILDILDQAWAIRGRLQPQVPHCNICGAYDWPKCDPHLMGQEIQEMTQFLGCYDQ